MKKNLPQIIIGVLVVGAISFYGGIKYETSKTTTTPVDSQQRSSDQSGGRNGGRMGGNRGGANGGGGFANGEVVSADNTGLTIKMRDGSSKIVIFSSSTQILKSATGTLSDVVAGTQVTIMGSPNTDGSITAQSIQIRPNTPSSTPNKK